jgi:hypothetical protein
MHSLYSVNYNDFLLNQVVTSTNIFGINVEEIFEII